MGNVLRRYATPFISGLFLVSLISGIALFFHVGMRWFHGMHEWLSMVLILPFVLHIWRNWRACVGYFRKPAFAIASVISLLAALAFVVPNLGAEAQGGRRGGPPQMALGQLVINSTVAEVAPLLGMTTDALSDALIRAGYSLGAPSARLADIAVASGKTPTDLAGVLLGLQN